MPCEAEQFVDLEIFVGGAWRRAAHLEAAGAEQVPLGFRGRTYFSYDFDYAAAQGPAVGRCDHGAVSARLPVDFGLQQAATWPSFALDLLPSGAGRAALLRQLQQADAPVADWPLLAIAHGPPGNVRAAPTAPAAVSEHPGFTYAEVVERGEGFIAYAEAHGAPVAGSSGAQGEAPKFLLTEDVHGRWHADGSLADGRAARHWLVKFPRGRTASDRAVLRNEAAYMAVAQRLGLRVHAPLRFDRNVLFVPRFDRRVGASGVERIGLESLCSLAGVAEHGAPFTHEQHCENIARFSTAAQDDLWEYLARDVLNVAMGNTDNHARNTAMAKYPEGHTWLSPLYDFAPMLLDRAGIPRACRWRAGETPGRSPEWGVVAAAVAACGLAARPLRARLARLGRDVARLADTCRACGVDDALVTRLAPRFDDVARALRAAAPAARRPR